MSDSAVGRPEPAPPGPSSHVTLRSAGGPRSVEHALVEYASTEHDLPGTPLRRTFRTGRAELGAFGVGFRSVVDLGLRAIDGHVRVLASDGDDLRFLPTSTGWLCTAGPLHRLSATTSGWSLVLDRHTHVEFDPTGTLRAWRTATGLLDTVVDRRGRIIVLRDRARHRRVHLDWDGARVVQVATCDGATASYTYGVVGDDADRLLRVVRPDGIVTYRWDGGAPRCDRRDRRDDRAS
jgi:YD repeat-containing protein